MPYRYGGDVGRRRLRPARRAEDRPFGDHRPTTPAYIRPTCTTNPRKHVLTHCIKATGFVERYARRGIWFAKAKAGGCRLSCVLRHGVAAAADQTLSFTSASKNGRS